MKQNYVNWSAIVLALCICLSLLDCAESDRVISKPVLQEIKNITAYEGEDVTVTCKAISDSGSLFFQWLVYDKVKQNIKVLKPKLEEHEYVFPSKNNKWHGVKLFLPKVSFADQREYTCFAGNYVGYDYKTFYLHVLRRKRALDLNPPRFRRTYANYSAFVGDREIKLICQVVAPKDSQYWWQKHDHQVLDITKKKFRYKQFRYLKIRNVKLSDAGDYTCFASNKAGRVSHTMHLYVTVNPLSVTWKNEERKPMFTNPEKMNRELLVFLTGYSAKMICDAEGNPTPTVIWYKNGKILRRIKEEPSTISPYQYNIVIKSLIPPDSGIYTCNVSNKWGYINKTYTLDVAERLISKPILQEIKNVTAYEGQNVTVTCNGISDGSPHFQWLIFDREKQNMTVLKRKLKEHEYVFPSKNNKWHGVKLFLPNVSSADQREYTCMAGNNVGYDYKTFYLHVLKRKQTSEFPTSANKRNEGK